MLGLNYADAFVFSTIIFSLSWIIVSLIKVLETDKAKSTISELKTLQKMLEASKKRPELPPIQGKLLSADETKALLSEMFKSHAEQAKLPKKKPNH